MPKVTEWPQTTFGKLVASTVHVSLYILFLWIPTRVAVKLPWTSQTLVDHTVWSVHTVAPSLYRLSVLVAYLLL